MSDRHVVTAFLHRAAQVLLLRRSEAVSTFLGRWAAVSGGKDAGTGPLDQALREVREETGLAAAQLTFESADEALVATDASPQRRFVVHPLRLHVALDAKPEPNWGHAEIRWSDLTEIESAASVPRLGEAWRRVAPGAIGWPSARRGIDELRADRCRGATVLALEGVALLGDAALAAADGRTA